MLLAGFEVSERFDTPVMLRMTTRISHTKTIVELGEPVSVPERKFVKDPSKYVMVPANAKVRHQVLSQRLVDLQKFSEETEWNRIESNGSPVGIIAGGVAYQHAKEVAPDFDYFKNWFWLSLADRTDQEVRRGA